MKLLLKLAVGFFILGLILLVEKYSDFDIVLQNHFFNHDTNQWLIDPAHHKNLSIFFYKGLKTFTMICGLLCLFFLLTSFKITSFQKYRKPTLILLLSLIFVPLIVAGAKYITNVYCPYQLEIYNGINPLVRIIDNYPDGFTQLKPGRCFPAGHATAGFAFMALFYCFNDRRKKILGLGFGILLGFTAGIYQMMRGQHFLSHTLFSMVASFMVIMIINKIISYLPKALQSAQNNR